MATASLGPGFDIDVPKLIKSRLLVQANSGGGKSWALRRLCEQTFGMVQHIVIDPESEFYTLREKHDYALFGKGGDGPADLKSAKLLARRLLELRLSAIVDIYELGERRQQFVKLFLEALIDVPRALWHPVLVVVDEAHAFCPEKGRGESASTSAVINLMTVGRKRGFCGVLATQRVSKLNKDAAAECKNKLVGCCTLDVDRKRAAEELGLSDKADILALRDLEPGEFHAYGPALSKAVTKLKVGPVKTTHPEAGEIAPPPAPPRAKVKALLAELANLPHEAEEEAKTVVELQQEIRRLKIELKKAESAQKVETVREAVPIINHRQVQRIEKLATRLTGDTDRLGKTIEYFDKTRDRLAQAQQAVVSEVDNLRREIQMRCNEIKEKHVPNSTLPPELRAEAVRMAMQRRPKIGEIQIGAQKHPPVKNILSPHGMGTPYVKQRLKEIDAEESSNGAMPPARQRLVDTLALLERLDIEGTRDVVAAWYGTHPNNKGFSNNVGALRTAGYVADWRLTDEGRALAHEIEIPTQDAVRERILRPLRPAQRRIVDVILEQDHPLGRDELAELLGVHPNNKGFTNNLGSLRTRQLLTKRWPIEAGPVLHLQGA